MMSENIPGNYKMIGVMELAACGGNIRGDGSLGMDSIGAEEEE